MSKVIDEIKEITAKVVAKKQDAAKLNYPKIIEKIKAAAALGFSECKIDESEMNEYDRTLLQTDGFRVYLSDKENKDNYKAFSQFGICSKEWVIMW